MCKVFEGVGGASVVFTAVCRHSVGVDCNQ